MLRINIVSSLLCCGVGIVPCLFNLLYYIIWWLHPSSTPRTSSGSTCEHLPHPSQEESLKVRYPSVCARCCDQDVLLFCSVICRWHPQIVSRVIMRVSNANLLKKWFVCHLIPSPFGPIYVTSANLSDLRHSITSPGCHLLRQSLVAIHNAMEIQKSWMQQLVIFSFIFRWCGDRSFALPVRGDECRTVQRTNWQGHSWRCQGKSWTACRNAIGVVINKRGKGILDRLSHRMAASSDSGSNVNMIPIKPILRTTFRPWSWDRRGIIRASQFHCRLNVSFGRGFFPEQQCVTRELLAAWSHYILLNASHRVLFLVAFLKS